MLSGVHHVRFVVDDLEAAIRWYQEVLGAQRLRRLDHHDDHGDCFAVILTLPGLDVPVQLRRASAADPAGTDDGVVTFSVPDRTELERWAAHLDAHGVEHSPVSTARIGFSMVVAPPVGTTIRLYTEPVGGLAAVAFAESEVSG